jgi:ubiquinone/menaquinone biosynthesis C-methylase UbiE
MYLTTIVIAIAAIALVLWSISALIARRRHPEPMHPLFSVFIENPLRRRFLSPRKSLDRIGVAQGMTVLELGPGPGFLTVEASRRTGSSGRLCSLDIAPAMISRVRGKITGEAADNVSLAVGNGECLPFKDVSFDLAYLVTVIGEIPDQDRAFQELHRVLRPGGILSVSEFLPDPDYPLKRTITRKALAVGFEPYQQFGNIINYVLNFRRTPC